MSPPSLSNHVLSNEFQTIRRLKDDLVMKNQDIKIISERLLDLMVSVSASCWRPVGPISEGGGEGGHPWGRIRTPPIVLLLELNDRPLREGEGEGEGGLALAGTVWPSRQRNVEASRCFLLFCVLLRQHVIIERSIRVRLPGEFNRFPLENQRISSIAERRLTTLHAIPSSFESTIFRVVEISI